MPKPPLITKSRKKVARAMRTGNMPGTHSSHLMESGEGDGKYKYQVNPTIFQNKDKTWVKPDTTEDKLAAYKEASKRGEVFGFKKQKRAEKFAAGSWKKGPDKREAMKGYRQSKK